MCLSSSEFWTCVCRSLLLCGTGSDFSDIVLCTLREMLGYTRRCCCMAQCTWAVQCRRALQILNERTSYRMDRWWARKNCRTAVADCQQVQARRKFYCRSTDGSPEAMARSEYGSQPPAVEGRHSARGRRTQGPNRKLYERRGEERKGEQRRGVERSGEVNGRGRSPCENDARRASLSKFTEANCHGEQPTLLGSHPSAAQGSPSSLLGRVKVLQTS